MSSLRNLLTVLGCAAASAITTLAAVAPSTTFADPVVQVTAEGTKIDSVLLNGSLVQDARSKTGWVMVITAENKSDKPENCLLVADLDRTIAAPMSRVPPRAMQIWQDKEALTLAAHEKITKRIDVAPAIAAQLTQTARDEVKAVAAQKQQNPSADANAMAMMLPRALYSVKFEAPKA
jgi:hypothetical protein